MLFRSTGNDCFSTPNKWVVSHCCSLSPNIILTLPPGTIAGQNVVYNNNCWAAVSTSVGTSVGTGVIFVGGCIDCTAVYPCGG